MNEHEVFEAGLKQVCKEICQITEKMQKAQTMTDQDLDRLDKLYHLKKSMLTCKAMDDADEYSEGVSGMRGRSPMTGRYVNRNMGNSGRQNFADGYSQGYSEAMSQMNGTWRPTW